SQPGRGRRGERTRGRRSGTTVGPDVTARRGGGRDRDRVRTVTLIADVLGAILAGRHDLTRRSRDLGTDRSVDVRLVWRPARDGVDPNVDPLRVAGLTGVLETHAEQVAVDRMHARAGQRDPVAGRLVARILLLQENLRRR